MLRSITLLVQNIHSLPPASTDKDAFPFTDAGPDHVTCFTSVLGGPNSLLHNFRLSCVTCFGQMDISDVLWQSLACACEVGLPFGAPAAPEEELDLL